MNFINNELQTLWIKLRPLIIFTTPFFLIGTLIGLYPGYRFYEYVWKDAGFCVTCHVHDYASVSWRESSHGKLTTCHDCHHQPLHEYVREAFVLVFKRPKFPKDLGHIPYVPKDICNACHLSNPKDMSSISGPLSFNDVKKLPKVDKMYLHKKHLEQTVELTKLKDFQIGREERMGDVPLFPPAKKGPPRPIGCSDCHGGPTNRAHNFSAVDLSCVRCHQDVHKKEFPNLFGCRNCHFPEFTLPVEN